MITTFIAGLGVQSKDLMFSISKNPQASMAEVLAKAEKYINGEEALISKKESSSTHKGKSGTDKRRGRSPKRQSMAEVLAKAEKYINDEEALISKKESSSTHKEKRRIDK